MNFIDLLIFLQSYSLPTVIIAISVSAIFFLVNLIFKDKIPAVINTFLPPLLCILIYFLVDVLLLNGSAGVETLSAAIICASLSFVITAIIQKIKSGKTDVLTAPLSPEALAIEEVINDYVDKDALYSITEQILTILCAEKFDNEKISDELANKIADLISYNAITPSTSEQFIALAYTVIVTYKALKNL